MTAKTSGEYEEGARTAIEGLTALVAELNIVDAVPELSDEELVRHTVATGIASAQVAAILSLTTAIRDLEGHLFDSETLPVRIAEGLRD